MTEPNGEAAGRLLPRLLADPRTRHCRVIVARSPGAYGAAAGATAEATAERRGASAASEPVILEKPLGLQSLLATVRRLLDH